MKYRIVLGFIITLLFMHCTSANAFHVKAETVSRDHPIKLGEQLSFQYTAPDLTIRELMFDPSWHHNWDTTENKAVRFNVNGRTLWLGGALLNNDEKPFDGVLHINHAHTDSINIYFVDRKSSKVIKTFKTGTQFPFSQRDLTQRTFAFSIELAPYQEIETYIRVTEKSYFYADITFSQKQTFEYMQSKRHLFNGVIVGILLLLSSFCLIVYLTSKATIFLDYGIFIACYLLFYMTQNGIAFQLLWPNTPEINQVSLTLSVGLTILSLSIFGRYPRIHNPPWQYKRLYYLNIFLSLIVIFSPIFLPTAYYLPITSAASLTVVFLSTLNIYIAVLMKQSEAKPYAIMWTLFLLSVVLLLLNRHGFIDHREFIEHFTFSGILLSSFFLAVSIANILQRKSQDNSSNTSSSLASDTLKHYYEIYQNAVEGMFSCDLEGNLISANETFIHTMGFKNFIDLQSSAQQKGLRALLQDDTGAQKLLERTMSAGFIDNEEIEVVRKDNRRIWLMLSMRVAPTSDNQHIYLHGTTVDVTKKHHVNQQLTYVMTHDVLTGAINRQELEKQLLQAMQKIQQKEQPTSLLYIDIHRLNLINESCGHTAGDSLLRQVSDQLKAALQDIGTLARVSSDEFVALLPNKTSNEAFATAYRLIESIKEFRFVWENNIFTVAISLGMTELTAHDKDLDSLLSRAESACKTAKDKGQNRIHIYADEDLHLINQSPEMEWVNIIKNALARDAFTLFFQTIRASNAEQQPLCYEILLKLQKDDGQLASSNAFINIAERYNLIQAIDHWVIDHYFRWLSQHPEHQQQLHFVCINISGQSAADPNFHTYLYEKFVQYDISPSKVCFELTEKSAIVNLAATLSFINSLKEQGCKFALDDFGSGFSSYGYLKNLPVDFIKIDGEFVKDLLTDPMDKAMVTSINSVAQAIGKLTIAESVESEELMNELTALGVDYMQGRFWHMPSPLSQIHRQFIKP